MNRLMDKKWSSTSLLRVLRKEIHRKMCCRPLYRLCVKNIHAEETKENIEKFYSRFGTVHDFNVKYIQKSQRLSQKATLRYDSCEEVAKAYRSLPHSFRDKVAYVERPTTYTLFVGRIPPRTTKQQVIDLFSKFGPVTHFDLKHDHNKNASLDFTTMGYVSFLTEDAVNNVLANGPHRVDRRELDVRRLRPKDCTLFVAMLPPNTTEETLINFYSQFGIVVYCKLRRDPITGNKRNHGYVTFATKKQLEKALTSCPHIINNKSVAVSRKSSGSCIHRSKETTIFLSNLSPSTTEESLEKYYSNFGLLLETTLLVNPRTLKSRCCAFISYGTKEEADAALNFRPYFLDGRSIDAYPYELQNCERSKIKSRTVFAEGLPVDVNDEALEEIFSQFGFVEKCDVIRDPITKECRGYGYISFSSVEEAQQALSAPSPKINDFEINVIPQPDIRHLRIPRIMVRTSPKITEHELMDFYSKFGNIIECRIIRDFHGQSLGIAFITFSSMNELSEALKKHTHWIGEQAVEARYGTRNNMEFGTKDTSLTLFVHSLSSTTTISSMLKFYTRFDPLVQCTEIVEGAATGKAYSFVRFSSRERFEKALKSRPHIIDDKRVIAQPALTRRIYEFEKTKERNAGVGSDFKTLSRLFSHFNDPTVEKSKDMENISLASETVSKIIEIRDTMLQRIRLSLRRSPHRPIYPPIYIGRLY